MEILIPADFFFLVYPLVAAAPRAFGFWLALPLLGGQSFPLLVRNAVAIAVMLFAYPIVASGLPYSVPTAAQWLLMVPKELAIGGAIGMAAGLVIWIVESAGGLIDAQSGMNNSGQMDPSSNDPFGAFGLLLRQLAVNLLLASGALVYVVVGLVASFRLWPWNAWLPAPDFHFQLLNIDSFMLLTNKYFALTLAIAAPGMVALWLIDFGLGLVNRATPRFDAYMIGMPVKALFSILAVAVACVFWIEAILDLIGDIIKFVRMLQT
jgi:type III secretion protein T